MNWDISVDIVSSLRAVHARIRGLICGWNNRCYSSPEPHFRWVSGTFFPAGKWPGRQATACYVSGDEISFYIYRSLNAILAQYKNCLLELTLRLSWKIYHLHPTTMACGGVCFD